MFKVKLFYYFLSKSCCELTFLLTFFSSHTILDTLFKGSKSFRNLFYFHDRGNEILNEGVILLVVAVIFLPTVQLSIFQISSNYFLFFMANISLSPRRARNSDNVMGSNREKFIISIQSNIQLIQLFFLLVHSFMNRFDKNFFEC